PTRSLLSPPPSPPPSHPPSLHHALPISISLAPHISASNSTSAAERRPPDRPPTKQERPPGASSSRWTPYRYPRPHIPPPPNHQADRKSTRLNSSHVKISYAVFCLKKKTT